MKNRLRVVVIIVIALALLYCIFTYLNERSAINATLKWGRLATFPQSASDFVITPEGNMFTRAFRVSFSAPPEDIARWVNESPGLREEHPNKEGSLRKYSIKPGGGAQHAEVVINDSTNQVRVYVAWS
jgi:hypothetical protein